MKEKRIAYIDIAKCIAMLLVIHNHWANDYNNANIKITIAAFHMPLFFILSGLIIRIPTEIVEVKDCFIKRFVTLMFPYYLWSLMFAGTGIKKMALIAWGSNISISMAGGAGGSWFIPCFFMASVISYFTIYLINKFNNSKLCYFTAIGCLLLISWLLNFINLSVGFPFNLDVAFSGAGFILMGNLLGMIIRDKKILENIRLKIAILISSGVLTVLFALLNITAYNNLYGRLVMALGYYGFYPWFILGGIAGSVCVIVLSSMIENIKLSGYLQSIGRNTFGILMVQQFFINIMEKVVNKLGVHLNLLYPILLSIVCLELCHLVVKIIVFIYPNLSGKGLLAIKNNTRSKI